jgi:hypothetical protein
MNTLAAMITGIIIGKQTQLPQIAANVPEFIKLPSTEKRFKRLIINENVTEQTYFLPFVQSVLINLGLEEMVLAIDGSLVGRGCICLMISLIYKRRALPLAFSVVKGKKGHLPEDTHVELVNKLHPLIPESTKQVVFLGDGEFDGTSLQQTLADFGRHQKRVNIILCALRLKHFSAIKKAGGSTSTKVTCLLRSG